jgi:hypothetical protein
MVDGIFGEVSPAGPAARAELGTGSRHVVAGGQAELHVWAGGFHGFDALYPEVPLSAAARRTRTGWLARTLDLEVK